MSTEVPPGSALWRDNLFNMKTYKIFILLFLCVILVTIGYAIPLDFTSPSTSTNMQFVYWNPYTNGNVLRYDLYFTPYTNSDTGTNWQTTTNWTQFGDFPPDTTNGSLWPVPATNGLVYVTLIVTLQGGLYTPPYLTNGAPYQYASNGVPNSIVMTNQPPYP